jgi:hypothetical protein
MIDCKGINQPFCGQIWFATQTSLRIVFFLIWFAVQSSLLHKQCTTNWKEANYWTSPSKLVLMLA